MTVYCNAEDAAWFITLKLRLPCKHYGSLFGEPEASRFLSNLYTQGVNGSWD